MPFYEKNLIQTIIIIILFEFNSIYHIIKVSFKNIILAYILGKIFN